MLIRKALETDLPTILELMNEAIMHSTSIYEHKKRDQKYMETWFFEKQTAKFPVLIYEIDRKPVAFGTYGNFRAGAAYRSSVEHSIHVHKDFQAKGIGKKLMLCLMEHAKKAGCHAMIAGIDSENKRSLQFHAKMGFQEKGRFPEIAFKFGKWLDLVLMQRLLTSE